MQLLCANRYVLFFHICCSDSFESLISLNYIRYSNSGVSRYVIYWYPTRSLLAAETKLLRSAVWVIGFPLRETRRQARKLKVCGGEGALGMRKYRTSDWCGWKGRTDVYQSWWENEVFFKVKKSHACQTLKTKKVLKALVFGGITIEFWLRKRVDCW